MKVCSSINKIILFSFMICLVSSCGAQSNSDFAISGSESLDVATSDHSYETSPEIDITESSDSDIDMDDTTSAEDQGSDVMQYDYKYKYYYDYIVSHADNGNMVFCPEAFHSSLSLYCFFFDEQSKYNVYNSIIGARDYLSFKSTDGFSINNSIWINDSKYADFVDNAFYSKYVNHFDGSNVLDVCKEYIMRITDSKTVLHESFISESDAIKPFSFVDFDLKWRNGDRMKGYSFDFEDSEGNINNCEWMSSLANGYSDDSVYYKGENARACKMYYDNGFELFIILPDRNTSLADINILDFMNMHESVSRIKDPVYFQMPVFGVESYIDMNASELGLTDIKYADDCDLDEDVSITQANVFKIGNVSDVVVDKSNFNSEDTQYMMCDHPFAFYVKDTINEDIVYIGVVNMIKE